MRLLRALILGVAVLLPCLFFIRPVAHASSPDPLSADSSTDPQAFEKYQQAIRQIFDENDLVRLGQLAEDARSNKEKFSGGFWKLTQIYDVLSSPKSGSEASETEWTQHFEHLQRWRDFAPDSITPRLVMAKSYVAYAGAARGGGYASTVSDDGWKLHDERTAKALAILADSVKLHSGDPMYYDILLDISKMQGWDLAQENALFEQAITAEPTFRRYYRKHAQYLRVDWYGKKGDIEKFADEMYSRFGPVEGPITYFEIATSSICNCDEERATHFSLGKMREGYALSAKTYGESLLQLNQLAYIEWICSDPVALEDLFNKIGTNYVAAGWQDPDNFMRAHQYLVGMAELNPPVNQAISAEMQTPEGQSYAKAMQASVEEKYRDLLNECRTSVKDDPRGFYFFLRQDASGKAIGGFTYPGSAFAQCFAKTAMSEIPTFNPPPKDDYWSRVVVRAN